MTSVPDRRHEIVSLSRLVGQPDRDLVILAEGNTSLRTAPNRMLVKATGCFLGTAREESFVEVDLTEFQRLIACDTGGDEAVAEMFARAHRWGTGRPSVESLLHAVCMEIDTVDAVVHTHPTPVNALLCSDQAALLTDGNLYPDQIVVLGRNNLLVPYVDPGLELARHVRRGLAEHRDTYGEFPKVIYLQNHGIFALGSSPEEAVQITDMAVKVARILMGALAIGRPVFLEEKHVDRIDTRPDEVLRRQMLAGVTATSQGEGAI
jgi:rhamnose utilization protein RhaD (predicted bifunctional aldolase and dehydrogenase)